MNNTANLLSRIEKLNSIGVALSRESDTKALLERILLSAKELTGADGGTLYLVGDGECLNFEIMHTNSLNIAKGGVSGEPIALDPIPLFTKDKKANDRMVAAYCVHHRETIKFSDVYEIDGFDFSGTRMFDQQMGYRSKSFLTMPMQNHEGDVIGVLQLINKINEETAEVISFSDEDQQLAESLASQAGITLTKNHLIADLKNLFEAFIKLIAGAIDEKSPYTGRHCRRVPILTMMLAQAANDVDYGPLSHFTLSEEDRYTLEVAAWLHDCGKVVTPEHIVDKATKLETIFDRVELIDTRFEVLKRDAEIRKLRQVNQLQQRGPVSKAVLSDLDDQYLKDLGEIEDNREFIRECNIGTEFMSQAQLEKIREIGANMWVDPDGDNMPFLSTEEIYNLTIPKGTLTDEERDVCNHHIVVTLKMLNSLPFPKHLVKVPEFAGAHHERMDGKGYPNGLLGEQMSTPARSMAIADIFEALTAKDRPYKEAKKLSESLAILGQMKQTGHIDPDLFEVFINERVYLKYAKKYLDPAQIDIEDPKQIPGYPFN